LFLIGAVLLWRQHSESGDDTEVADPGRGLLKIIPMAWLTRGAAVVMLAPAEASIVTALS